MVKDDSSLGSCILVVGDPDRGLVQTATVLAREARSEAVPCDSVYAAVAQIARRGGRRVLAVGLMQELARENCAFFRIAAAQAVPCCCLLDANPPAGRPEDLRRDPTRGERGPQCKRTPGRTRTQDLLVALRAGATVLTDVQDLAGFLKEWLATPPAHESSRTGREPAPAKRRAHDVDTSYRDLRATEAELRALLG
jgi:hypothetical protein